MVKLSAPNQPKFSLSVAGLKSIAVAVFHAHVMVVTPLASSPVALPPVGVPEEPPVEPPELPPEPASEAVPPVL